MHGYRLSKTPSTQVWTDKNLYGFAFRLHVTRGTVQKVCNFLTWSEVGHNFLLLRFRFYADSCKHLNCASFCTACAVKTWSLATRHWTTKQIMLIGQGLPNVVLKDILKNWLNLFKWRYDRRSGNCNLSNCKLTRKKNSGLQRDSNPWPQR